MTIAESLKRFRREFNLNQKEVAETVGMVPQAYYRYESGKFVPQADLIITLAQTYNVTTDYLLGLSDEPRPRPLSLGSEQLLNTLLECRDLIQAALDNKVKSS